MRYRVGLLSLIVVVLVATDSVWLGEKPWSAMQAGVRHPFVIFVADGMRQERMEELVADGRMPTYQRLMARSVDAGPGMVPLAPAVCAPNWVSISTGLSPAVHGAVNNWFHDDRMPFTQTGLDGHNPANYKGETIAQRAEAKGLKVVVIAWKTFDIDSLHQGVALDSAPALLSGRGVVTNFDIPRVDPQLIVKINEIFIDQPLILDRVTLSSATGWTLVPPSFSPPRETVFDLRPGKPQGGAGGPQFFVYIYDSTDDGNVNYDWVLVATSKRGQDWIALLRAGQWSGSISVEIAGERGKFYLKLVDLAPDLSRFRLYFTSITRAQATPPSLARELDTQFDGIVPWFDVVPLVAGLIDSLTFIEQLILWERVVGDEITPFLIETVQPDLVMAGTGVPDMMQHILLGRATFEAEVGTPFERAVARAAIDHSYIAADRMLGHILARMPLANVIATSDHGFSATSGTICGRCVLNEAGLFDPNDLSNSKAVAYGLGNGGSLPVYVNLEGRNPGGIVPAHEYEQVRRQIVAAFQRLGPAVIERILLQEQTRAITETLGVTTNAFDPHRVGDVLVFAASAYTFNVAVSQGSVLGTVATGDHGHIPNGETERFAAFLAAGPDIVPGAAVSPVTPLDIVPTVASALEMDPPAGAEGRVLPILGVGAPIGIAPEPTPAQSRERPVGGTGMALKKWELLLPGILFFIIGLLVLGMAWMRKGLKA